MEKKFPFLPPDERRPTIMTSSRRILVIDDDREFVHGASIRLRAAGYQTISAYNGDQGVVAANENQPDAIVLDVRMPVKDGLTALAELREQNDTKGIPIVMLSASLSDQQRALDGGARFFLRKPYQPNTLVAAVETAIRESDADQGD